ncbi:GntR family transcriptional regulator [Cohnella hashimotonis]|uniref:GntR family transcriptional regulator n=1 Tax=Cohnella hashimotonis TaxID=2826895 RepID=A0ABT6TJ09_9BACL|nr:GntR family transcriptional regulator [Cohnella hashimotonis]MDI4645837.1 GntR family transcriptional regulator [Cohnella hashimotonis]
MNKLDDPLARSLQAKEIVKRLRTDIILGEYKSGSRLIEAKVADRLGCSRAPIRTAFQLLSQEGLVLNLSNGGTEVIGFTSKQAHDLFDLRLLLEQKALEQILANRSFHFRPLFEAMEDLEQRLSDSENRPSSADTSVLDIQFHRSLMTMAQNSPLLAAWHTMANVLQAILEITNMTSATYRQFYESHRRLADLVIQRSPEALDELTRHIANAKAIIIARLEQNMKP